MKKAIVYSLGIVLLSFLAACSSATKNKNDDQKLYILSTTGMIDDAVARIAGDLVAHDALMGPGVDPHLYKATQGDLSKLNKADLIFYNGLHLEGKMGDIFEKLSRRKNIQSIGDRLPPELLRISSEFSNGKDPHIWFNVSLWMEAVKIVEKALVTLDKEHADVYHKNTANYLEELKNLHEEVRRKIAAIPVDQRILVTAHDAFGYFGEAYGIEVKGLQGISTVSEYGLKDIGDMVDMITEKKIKAVFVESSVPAKALEAVVEGCELKGHQLVIGGELFSDAMGDKNTPEGNYIGMVKHNTNTIYKALK